MANDVSFQSWNGSCRTCIGPNLPVASEMGSIVCVSRLRLMVVLARLI